MTFLSESQELARQSGTIEVGLSWDLIPGSAIVDLDASAVLFNSTGTLVDAVYYNQLSALNGAVMHSGDCKRGEKEGFDEIIKISLDDVKGVNVIVFTINAFSGGTLENCESAFCEIKIEDIVLATLSASCAQTGSSSALLMCALFRHPDTMNWHYTVIRQPASGKHFSACLLPIRAVVDQLIDPGALGERSITADKTFEMSKGDQLTIPFSVKKLVVGLGWTTKTEGLDLDASCIMLGPRSDGQLYPVDVCYFVQKKRPGVESMGDNMTGVGEGDDEKIVIDLDKVEKHVTALVIVVTIYSLNRTFGEVENSYVRLMNESGSHVYAKYTLSGALTKNGLIFCELIRGAKGEPWTLVTLGEECEGRSARQVKSLQWEGDASNIDYSATGGVPTVVEPSTTTAHSGAGDGCCVIC